ncbi:PPC domain-containing protein [Actinoplanes sp. RD1]|uniref:PPC domain-containing protein n=1 Tax=Actinoplanes sp. RD1 TaxID=3064538 RepID=UPI002740F7B5|nr:PPC domain-containing protein [Actinoplanes sp. RD1]
MKRRSIAAASVAALGLATLAPGVAQAAPDTAAAPAAAAPGAKPKGPNPFLAELPPGAQPDYLGWAKYLKRQAAAKTAARLKSQGTSLAAKAAAAVVVDEDEPDGTNGSNETPADAQRVRNFGTGAKQNAAIRVLGQLDNEAVTPVTRAANPEDDGSIPLAGPSGVGPASGAATIAAQIGDGPHGRAAGGSGDFDFYRVEAAAGQTITADTLTDPDGPLDTMAAIYAADGTRVAFNDDQSLETLDSYVTYRVTTAGTYYVAIEGWPSQPQDPFDSGSGLAPGTEGDYSVTISSAVADQDFYAIQLRPGDVLGASVKGSATYLTVYDTDPKEVHGSSQDATSIYPPQSPLPGGGNAATDYVATKAGWHYVGVTSGSGAYDITVEAYRPPLEGAKPTQTLFLDFDGGRVNTGIFGGTGNVTLSPFSAFVARWGIPRAQEDELIDAIVAETTENLKQDLIDSGLNKRFKLRILNSKDHADPWGQENVSRIVVGGTIAESGVPTIGIAQSIDPGNFGTEETALVLQDVLSEPGGVDAPASLNTYLTPASDRIAFVAQAEGNVIAHEAGHFFGNWHTDNASENVNLQDAGGANYDALFGVGPDGVGGTADDTDVDFGLDRFSPAEGFVGTEDTLGRIVFGLTS